MWTNVAWDLAYRPGLHKHEIILHGTHFGAKLTLQMRTTGTRVLIHRSLMHIIHWQAKIKLNSLLKQMLDDIEEAWRLLSQGLFNMISSSSCQTASPWQLFVRSRTRKPQSIPPLYWGSTQHPYSWLNMPFNTINPRQRTTKSCLLKVKKWSIVSEKWTKMWT